MITERSIVVLYLAEPREIDAISGPPVDPQLHHAFAYWFHISKIPMWNPCRPGVDPDAGLPVNQIT